MNPSNIMPGDIYQTKEGGSVAVVEYRGCYEILIEHQDENRHQTAVQMSRLRSGQIKNPYRKSIYGVGFIGAGNFLAHENGKASPAYTSWRQMIQRSYYPNYHARHPTYLGVTVCPEWLNFQNYALWWTNEPNSNSKDYHLDKDLKADGNKEYSPRTCSFVPVLINTFLTCSGSTRGSLPQGVRAQGDAFQASLDVKGNRVYLGTYKTPDQAGQAYREAKEKSVKLMAEEWKSHLHVDVYNRLKVWRLV